MFASDYKVLLGDDDPAMLRLLSCWLDKAGYATRTAADGQEALDAIELECPDLIITDWDMPRLNGFELCRLVRKMILPHYVYIIFLTAKTATEQLVAGLEIGADDFLGKPVSQAELLARVRSGTRVLDLERRLNLMARTDSLTGLMTQGSFYEDLEREWHRSRRFGTPLSCVMVDLDFFKQINDVHGHPTGDSALKIVAELLVDNCRASDVVCRYGGEEFCVMLPQTAEKEAALWAERVRQRMASLNILQNNRPLRVTGSFGVAQCRDHLKTSEDIVDLADQALLCAKRNGRDQVVAYSTLIDAAELSPEAGEIENDIFSNVLARDIMAPLEICLHEDETIDSASRLLLQLPVPSTPVLNRDGELAGFLSEKDLMAAMTSPEAWRRPVSSVMRPNVVSYEESTPIRSIYDFLARVSIRRVVVTKNGRPTGTINRNLLLRWVRKKIIDTSPIPHHVAFEPSPGCNTAGMASGLGPHSPDIGLAFHSAE